MQEPKRELDAVPAREYSASTESRRAVRDKMGRARFTRHDACYDPRSCEVTIGLWLLDRTTAQYAPGPWPIRRAIVHWRRHNLTVAKALNYEFQIDEDVPYAVLSQVSFQRNEVVFRFGRAMRITIGIGELCITSRRTKEVRMDWGTPGWAFTMSPTGAPLVTTRGTKESA